jgi:hypothetical protein
VTKTQKTTDVAFDPIPVENQVCCGQSKQRSSAPDMNRKKHFGGNGITKYHREYLNNKSRRQYDINPPEPL